MKVLEVRTYVLKANLSEPFFFSQPGLVTQRGSLIVEIVTDNGISGFGEAMCNGLQPPELAGAVIDHLLRDMVLGRNVEDVAVLHAEMSNRLRDFGRQGAPMAALSGLDIALWDALGKQQQQPVHKLLGGAFREKVAPYATGFYRTDTRSHSDLVAEAVGHVDAGFRSMKIKIGFGIDADIELIGEIRRAVGSQVRLMADANRAYDAGSARRLVLECANLDVYWLEEPIDPSDLNGMRELRSLGTSVLIAAGESECGLAAFLPWASERAVDVFQPDLSFVGGFTTMRQIGWFAHAAGIIVNPHVWGTAVGLAAALQAIASLPPTPISRGFSQPMLEFDSSSHPFRRSLIEEEFDLTDGFISIPDRPGIGVTINRDQLEQFSTK